MKQKNLTKEQMAICKDMLLLFEKAKHAGIKFVFDHADYLLSAYNGKGIESVEPDIPVSMRKDDVKFDWAKTCDIVSSDFVNTYIDDAYIIPIE